MRLFAERGASGLVIGGRDATARKRAEAIRTSCGCIVHFAKAAITDRGTILVTDPALFDRMFAINTRAPFF